MSHIYDSDQYIFYLPADQYQAGKMLSPNWVSRKFFLEKVMAQVNLRDLQNLEVSVGKACQAEGLGELTPVSTSIDS